MARSKGTARQAKKKTQAQVKQEEEVKEEPQEEAAVEEPTEYIPPTGASVFDNSPGKKVIIPGINDDDEDEIAQPMVQSVPNESNGDGEKPPMETMENKDLRNSRSLFIKNLPRSITDEELKELSPDILSVNIPMIIKGKRFGEDVKKVPRGYAYLLFLDEETAEKNYELLQEAKLGDRDLHVDYVGKKSTNPMADLRRKRNLGDPDPCRLYVTGLKMTELDETILKELLFPTAARIDIPKKDGNIPVGFAFVSYETHAETKAVHDQMVGKKVNGDEILVEFARQKKRKFRRHVVRRGGGGAKRMRDEDDENENGEDGDQFEQIEGAAEAAVIQEES